MNVGDFVIVPDPLSSCHPGHDWYIGRILWLDEQDVLIGFDAEEKYWDNYSHGAGYDYPHCKRLWPLSSDRILRASSSREELETLREQAEAIVTKIDEAACAQREPYYREKHERENQLRDLFGIPHGPWPRLRYQPKRKKRA